MDTCSSECYAALKLGLSFVILPEEVSCKGCSTQSHLFGYCFLAGCKWGRFGSFLRSQWVVSLRCWLGNTPFDRWPWNQDSWVLLYSSLCLHMSGQSMVLASFTGGIIYLLEFTFFMVCSLLPARLGCPIV